MSDVWIQNAVRPFRLRQNETIGRRTWQRMRNGLGVISEAVRKILFILYYISIRCCIVIHGNIINVRVYRVRQNVLIFATFTVNSIYEVCYEVWWIRIIHITSCCIQQEGLFNGVFDSYTCIITLFMNVFVVTSKDYKLNFYIEIFVYSFDAYFVNVDVDIYTLDYILFVI